MLLFFRLLEGMFVVGSLGCIAVLILTSIDDLRVLLGEKEKAAEKPPTPIHHAEQLGH